MLADAILIPPRPPIPPTNKKKVRGSAKNVRIQVTEKPFIVKMKKGDVGIVNASLKSTETREELSTNCNLISERARQNWNDRLLGYNCSNLAFLYFRLILSGFPLLFPPSL